MKDSISIYLMTVDDAKAIDVQYCKARFPNRYGRAQKFRFEADRLRSYAAGYLVERVLHIPEEELETGEYGKPFAKGKTPFSLSHSGKYILLASAEGMIGADIEQKARTHLEVAPRVFTPEEINWMRQESDQRFVTLWTLKEAASKASGKGLNIDYHSFSVLPMTRGEPSEIDGIKLFALTGFLEDYAYSVVTSQKYNTLSFKAVKYGKEPADFPPIND